jgi:signal transduction histidine kinase
MKPIGKAIIQLWIAYRTFVYSRIQIREVNAIKDISFWRDTLFKNTVLYSLPFSFIASIPAIIVAIGRGDAFSYTLYVLTVLGFSCISLSKNLGVKIKKTIICVLIYSFGTILTVLHGYYGAGLLYLYASTIFIVLVFSERLGYMSIAFHIVVTGSVALIIENDFGQSLQLADAKLSTWVLISCNLVFLSTIGVLIISRLINGLDATIRDAFNLRDNLARQLATIEAHNIKLTEIAYLQSHLVRAPLASSIGLIQLLKITPEEKPDPEVIHHLETAIRELDAKVKAIIKSSEKI